MAEITTTTTTTTTAATTPKKKAPGLTFKRFFTKAGVSPYDELEWETAPGADHRLAGRHHLRAEGRRGPEGLVDDGDQHRRQQISARPDGHARARDRRAPAGDPRR